MDAFIDKSTTELGGLFKKSIDEQSKAMAHTVVDYKEARLLKEDSDERRLQPIYIRLFFERAFKYLGGSYRELSDGIYQIDTIPEVISK